MYINNIVPVTSKEHIQHPTLNLLSLRNVIVCPLNHVCHSMQNINYSKHAFEKLVGRKVTLWRQWLVGAGQA